jgi:hypothetical protein
MSLPFNLGSVPAKAMDIEGFDIIKNSFPTKSGVRYSEAVVNALNDVASEYQNWPEDQGFGSSDMTYVVMLYIDTMITYAGLRGYYETGFGSGEDPRLKVVEYSEMEYHEAMLRREQGI